MTKISNEGETSTSELQTVFEKLFGNGLKSITDLAEVNNSEVSTDDKNDIILGALRDILFICEVCKKKILKPGKLIIVSFIPTSASNTIYDIYNMLCDF